LYENIINAKTLKEVEEIYKPYKLKKKTKAMVAIEKWFQVVADFLKTNPSLSTTFQGLPLEKEENKIYLEELFSLFKREYPEGEGLLKKYTREEIIEGAIHIISAEISSNSILRDTLREYLLEKGIVTSKTKTKASLSKLNEKDTNQIPKFDIYSDFNIEISRLKPYQILALNRWEKLKILNIKIEKSEDSFILLKEEYSNILKINTKFILELEEAFISGFTTLFKSVENEVRWIMNEIWEDDAIKSFSSNLGALLLTKPEYGKTILAIDPWFRAGCKIVILDKLWNPILFDKIFLSSIGSSKEKISNILKKYPIDVIVVWNWTGVNETVELLNDITSLDIFIVNESGASVYSVSKTAQEEFPDLDSLDRGTLSIGRRYIDPLSELVKVPVESIWVWMYQHDIPVKKLEEKLWFVVEDVVNEVWINVNNASSYVLNHISWIDKRWAKKIYNHRPYRSREALKKVLSDKAYEQAAGFLRVPDSKEELDNTDIHPEQYELAKYIIKPHPWIPFPLQEKEATKIYSKFEIELKEIYPDVSIQTVEFIIDSINQSWVEKRINSTHKKASKKVDIESIKEWDILEWVIRNVVAFWAFVDIWLKNDWLVHISQLADAFVKDPNDFVEVWQQVKVKLTGIDKNTWKIQLSMKDL